MTLSTIELLLLLIDWQHGSSLIRLTSWISSKLLRSLIYWWSHWSWSLLLHLIPLLLLGWLIILVLVLELRSSSILLRISIIWLLLRRQDVGLAVVLLHSTWWHPLLRIVIVLISIWSISRLILLSIRLSRRFEEIFP